MESKKSTSTVIPLILSSALEACSGTDKIDGNVKNNSDEKSGHVQNTNQGVKETANHLSIDGKSVEILNGKSIKSNFVDNSWNGVSVSIIKIKIWQTSPFIIDETIGNKGCGLIILHTTITANRDISVFPDQGTLITNEGQQIEASNLTIKGLLVGSFGDIAKGSKMTGDLIFPVELLKDINDISSLRLKFDAYEEIGDETYDHEYDMTLEFK